MIFISEVIALFLLLVVIPQLASLLGEIQNDLIPTSLQVGLIFAGILTLGGNLSKGAAFALWLGTLMAVLPLIYSRLLRCSSLCFITSLWISSGCTLFWILLAFLLIPPL